MKWTYEQIVSEIGKSGECKVKEIDDATLKKLQINGYHFRIVRTLLGRKYVVNKLPIIRRSAPVPPADRKAGNGIMPQEPFYNQSSNPSESIILADFTQSDLGLGSNIDFGNDSGSSFDFSGGDSGGSGSGSDW